MWGSLGDLVVALHAAYLVFQALGGLLVLWFGRQVLLLHLAAVTWGIVIVAMHWRCPLTVLEKSLRSRSGEAPYPESFLDHYVFGSYLPDGSQPWVYGLHLVVIVVVYLVLAERWLGAGGVRPARQVAT
ncbi:DUF2784 domain-containing protein [Nocardioides gansuensis]|uniref:DUF2784 domain-containing protein n=1 Tax=Nocardioides gansuensis TaxID=2138300 RepID=A0A2T8F5S0_9ACTN|nr:DUF2784 domain-containing protein [Nocardioides gansuensis]PVG81053.1 DUF2784 domain-containing protein [Nocardioides gansuensis]